MKSCSEVDFSRSSMGVGSMFAAPGNVVVGMGGVNDGDGVMLSSIGVNFVLLIALGLKGKIPVFLNPFFIVARLIDLSKDSLKIAVKFVLLMFW